LLLVGFGTCEMPQVHRKKHCGDRAVKTEQVSKQPTLRDASQGCKKKKAKNNSCMGEKTNGVPLGLFRLRRRLYRGLLGSPDSPERNPI